MSCVKHECTGPSIHPHMPRCCGTHPGGGASGARRPPTPSVPTPSCQAPSTHHCWIRCLSSREPATDALRRSRGTVSQTESHSDAVMNSYLRCCCSCTIASRCQCAQPRMHGIVLCPQTGLQTTPAGVSRSQQRLRTCACFCALSVSSARHPPAHRHRGLPCSEQLF
jgi:hypothetical protein